MNKNSKIYIAGHHGLVGSAIWSNLKARGYENLVGKSHSELDLLDPVAVKTFFHCGFIVALSDSFFNCFVVFLYFGWFNKFYSWFLWIFTELRLGKGFPVFFNLS